jgi:hypothetical protein
MKKLLLISVLLSCAAASAQQLHFTVTATNVASGGDVMAGSKAGDSVVNAISHAHHKTYSALDGANGVAYIVCCPKLSAGETLTGEVLGDEITATRDSDHKEMKLRIVSSKASGE